MFDQNVEKSWPLFTRLSMVLLIAGILCKGVLMLLEPTNRTLVDRIEIANDLFMISGLIALCVHGARSAYYKRTTSQ